MAQGGGRAEWLREAAELNGSGGRQSLMAQGGGRAEWLREAAELNFTVVNQRTAKKLRD